MKKLREAHLGQTMGYMRIYMVSTLITMADNIKVIF
jgi:hypothetical protein